MGAVTLGRVALREFITLDLVPAPETGVYVVRIGAGTPVYSGPGPANYVCGRCGAVLCEGVRAGMLASVIFECSCGEFNRVPRIGE